MKQELFVENKYHVLITKEPKVYIFNCKMQLLKQAYHNVVSGKLVRFYVITYENPETVEFLSIQKLGDLPQTIGKDFFEQFEK